MSRPRIRRVQLPPHVHWTCSKGKEYYCVPPFRGTKRAGPRVRRWVSTNTDGSPTQNGGPPIARHLAWRRQAGAGTFTALVAEYQRVRSGKYWRSQRARSGSAICVLSRRLGVNCKLPAWNPSTS